MKKIEVASLGDVPTALQRTNFFKLYLWLSEGNHMKIAKFLLQDTLLRIRKSVFFTDNSLYIKAVARYVRPKEERR